MKKIKINLPKTKGKDCKVTCGIWDGWCMCEAVQLIQTYIEDDLKGLSSEEKGTYYQMLQKRIEMIPFKHFTRTQRGHST